MLLCRCERNGECHFDCAFSLSLVLCNDKRKKPLQFPICKIANEWKEMSSFFNDAHSDFIYEH